PSARLPEAQSIVERAFTDKDPGKPKGVRRDIEKILGPRGEWSATDCRLLWETCMQHGGHRGKTPLHELNWLRLTGWCLRPGFGAPDDEARIDRMWAIHDEGLLQKNKANWPEWWILWRRIAPGLDTARQGVLFEDVRPWLWRDAKPPPGPHAHGQIEMIQLLAALERLPAEHKQKAGELFWDRADKVGSYWPLGRLGAREPFHGDPADVVPPAIAEAWLQRLLELDWKTAEGASFAAASIARLTGDPARDID